jgi:hypothetical protein
MGLLTTKAMETPSFKETLKRAAPNLFSMKLPLVRFLQRLNSLPTSAGQGFVPSCRILPAAECIVEVPESLRGVLKSQERERER